MYNFFVWFAVIGVWLKMMTLLTAIFQQPKYASTRMCLILEVGL